MTNADHAIDQAGGHTMKVTFIRDTVFLEPLCHEPPGAVCRVTCPAGCESYSYPEHEHGLENVDYCNAVECLTNGDCIPEMCEDTVPFPLSDGMPIEVSWDGHCYWWSPVREERS